ncbi:adhesion G-protein coupled receptor G7-like [Amphiura filiformis]|uniref:adhesion G-protein coupled receptor G7-like n=1 Tax=Amphiura filiformis TaxID=82378 RepID=UPI003B20E94D
MASNTATTVLLNLAVVLLIMLVVCTDTSQQDVNPTNTLSGNYFIFCFPTNRRPMERHRTMSIQLHSVSYTNVTNVYLTAPGISWSSQVILNRNRMATTVTAPAEAEANIAETLQTGTIIITSDSHIYVTAVSYAESSLATFPVPPFDSASGYEFFIANYQPAPKYPSEIVLTSSDAPANVVMTKHQGMSFNDLVFPGDFQYSENGDGTIRFVLPSKQSLQLLCSFDCTGLKITTDKPITVLSGGECTFVTVYDLDCDHIAAYMPSVDRLGQHFTLGPFAARDAGYVARIVAAQDDTNVTLSSFGTFPMNTGQYLDKDITTEHRVITITATRPILVVQFAKGQTSDSQIGHFGDPFMMIVPPQEQYINSITFAHFGLQQYELSSYLSLVLPCKLLGGMLFNGEVIEGAGWEAFQEGNQCVVRKELSTSGINHITHLSSEAKFGAFFYGFGNELSFGHALDHNSIHITEPVIPVTYCPEDETEDDELGILSWPRTTAGTMAQSNQRCPLDSEKGGDGKAKRLCAFDEEQFVAMWMPHETQSCGEITEVELDDLPQIPVVEDNVEEVANALEDLTDDIKTITPEDMENVADTLSNIVAVETSSEEVTTLVVETVNNLILGEIISDDSSNSSSSIILSLEHQIEVSLRHFNSVRIIEPALAVNALTINTTEDGTSNIIGGLTFFVKQDKDENGLTDKNVKTVTDVSQVPENIETSIVMPENLFAGMKGTQQVSFKVYQESSLFISPSKDQNLIVAGSVVSGDILGSSKLKFEEPITIKFLPYQIPDIASFVSNTSLCVFWDFDLQNGVGDWSTEGCTFVGIENDRVVCQCNHLTNFAVLMDITGHGRIDAALNVITYVGCAISIIALVLTLCIFIGFRKLRSTRQRVVLIHFCISLLSLYVVFVAGIDTAVNSKVGCVVVAALIHYFTLTTMMWMAVEARNLYSKLVTVFGAERDWFMKVATLIAWGCPLIVVGVAVGIAHDQYTSDDHCFISPGPLFYYAQILPIGLVLLHNSVTFIVIMYSIHTTRMNTAKFKDTNRKEEIYARLQNAITISVLLGLTWVFGFLAMIPGATETFQVLFCIFNSLQGLMIFILFCCRAEDVRKVLTPYYCGWIKVPSRETSYDVGKRETASSAAGTSTA